MAASNLPASPSFTTETDAFLAWCEIEMGLEVVNDLEADVEAMEEAAFFDFLEADWMAMGCPDSDGWTR